MRRVKLATTVRTDAREVPAAHSPEPASPMMRRKRKKRKRKKKRKKKRPTITPLTKLKRVVGVNKVIPRQVPAFGL